jgi:hypothetical protein
MAQKGRPKKIPIEDKISNAIGIAVEAIESANEESEQEDITTSTVVVNDTSNVGAKVSNNLAVYPQQNLVPKNAIPPDALDDYTFSRSNLHGLLKKGNTLLNGAVELAESSEQPRAYEVAGNLLKTLIEGTRELLALQKDMIAIETSSGIKIEDETDNSAPSSQNIIMDASTLEVLEYFTNKKKEKKG